ncbi:MAG: FlgD immunoglobulin-like domain containing protein, partial [candidate division WOR-3 bacterium]
GATDTVSFPQWTATPPGLHVVRCSTGLTRDGNQTNDTLSRTILVTSHVDAASIAILAPTGTVDSGTVVTPQARIANLGTSPALIPVRITIGSNYADTALVPVAARETTLVSFHNWIASPLGTHAVKCSTSLAEDTFPTNDTVSAPILVRVRIDAAAQAILAPVGFLDSGTTVTPQAIIANKGVRVASIPVHFSIGLGYHESTLVTLLPDSGVTLSLREWVANEFGTFRVCCSTALIDDVDPANDTAVEFVIVNTRIDASCYRILSPTGVLDSGCVVVPAAQVTNLGTGHELIPVVMNIDGGYCDTAVASVAPGESVSVYFSQWVATPAGRLGVRSATVLTGDTIAINDTAVDSVFVATRPDAAVTDIYAPLGVVDSGTAVVPCARICNYGSSPANVPVRFRIGAEYDETRVKYLGIGSKDTVQFPAWTSSPLGTHAVLCSTALAGDVRPENNSRFDSVRVTTTIDAGVVAILAPAGRIDSGMTVVPSAVISNCGTSPAFIPVRMQIGPDYDSMVFKLIRAGAEDTVPFPAWLASPIGEHVVRCSTAVPGDLFAGNDRLDSRVRVGVSVDAACLDIQVPTGTVDSGTVVTPQVLIANYSTSPKNVPLLLRIGNDYVRGRRKQLAGGTTDTVLFPPWQPHLRGIVAMTCSTALHGDERTKNDVVRKSVFVYHNIDATVLDILVPSGTVDSGHAVIPKARIANHGAASLSIPVEFRIGDFYRSIRSKSIAAGTADTLHFDVWSADQPGRHAVCCTTMLDGDLNPANDSRKTSVSVLWYDAGCVAILAPPGLVGAGDTIVPRTWVRNLSTQPTHVPAVFRYGTLYAQLRSTDTIPPGDSAELVFPALVAESGAATASCSTALLSDMNPTNDKLALTVYGAVRRVTIEPDTAATAPPASIVSYFMRCRNEGNAADTIDITHCRTRAGWRVELLDSATLEPLSDHNGNGLPDLGHIPRGGSAALVCRLTLPHNERGLAIDSTEVLASSGTVPSVNDRCRTYTTVREFASLVIEPDQLCQVAPTRPHDYVFTITNLGNTDDYADLALHGTKGRWRHELLDKTGRPLDDRNANGRRDIGPIPRHNGTAAIVMRLTPDSRAQVGECDTATVVVQSFVEAAVTDTAVAVSVISGAVRSLVVEPDQAVSVNIGATTQLPLWVETMGEIRAVVNVNASCSRPDWQLRLLDETGHEELHDTDFDSVPDLGFVVPTSRTRFALQITAPGCEYLLGQAESLTAIVTIVASLSGDSAVRDSARVDVTAIPNFEVHNLANPFSDRTRFIISTPSRGRINLLVYNRLGELVRSIIKNEDRGSGVYSVEWDGTNDLGHRLAPGIYLYVFEATPADGTTRRIVRKAVLRR